VFFFVLRKRSRVQSRRRESEGDRISELRRWANGKVLEELEDRTSRSRCTYEELKNYVSCKEACMLSRGKPMEQAAVRSLGRKRVRNSCRCDPRCVNRNRKNRETKRVADYVVVVVGNYRFLCEWKQKGLDVDGSGHEESAKLWIQQRATEGVERQTNVEVRSCRWKRQERRIDVWLKGVLVPGSITKIRGRARRTNKGHGWKRYRCWSSEDDDEDESATENSISNPLLGYYRSKR